MSDRAANTPSSGTDSLLSSLVAEGLNPSAANKIELAIEAMIQAQVEQRIQAEIDRKIQSELDKFIQEEKARQDAQFDQHVAHEVVQKVLEIIEQNRLARHRQFGASSEAYQGTLFNEAELLTDQNPDEDDESCDEQAPADDTSTKPSRKKKSKARGHRGPLPPELPRVEVLIDVPQDQRTDARGQPMVRIGEEVSEQLDIIPMKIRVIRTVRPKYAPARGDGKPVIAAPPANLLPRSILSAGAMAMVIAVKFVDGMPLFRIAKILARSGVHLPPQTLARNCIKTAQALQPLYNLLQDTLLDGSIIHMDETYVQVLKEPERKATTKSYMWVRRGGPPGKTVVLFDYEQNRSGKTPALLLEGWRGHLMTDCYSGYNGVGHQPGVIRMACMAHCRREFVKADRANPSRKETPAKKAIKFFARLYRIEKRVRNAPDSFRYQVRQRLSKRTLDELRAWLDQMRPLVTPKSQLGKALAYLDNCWDRMVRYIDRGDLPIDNNEVHAAGGMKMVIIQIDLRVIEKGDQIRPMLLHTAQHACSGCWLASCRKSRR
ncbi:IS66 family transposase [Orrella marina]|uniref:IS66 family transposase n=1 Tax=Orrella marina TaxID=2163011 RepID=A0A2R4XM37_9BURK|nr:IS66 family transposase [Orrella marina]AWB34870.1 IS66 family transposase [Orrella marina]